MQPSTVYHKEDIDIVPQSNYQLADFWAMSPAERQAILLDAIAGTHAWHYQRNRAYRNTVGARGVGPTVDGVELSRLLRPTSQTFKSYIDILGTPFPQDRPRDFLDWLDEQLSVELPRERLSRFQARYGSLEALLRDIEHVFADFGFEVSTSSGTSGRSTIMLRDQAGLDKTVESFYLSFQRYLGMEADHRAIFIMPRRTRIAMARMAAFSVRRVGLTDDRVHFAIPFPAEPDRVRIRAGRTFRPGWRGIIEQNIWHPFMNWMQDHYVTQRAVDGAVDVLRRAEATSEKVLLFGGWVQLHAIAKDLQQAGCCLRLAPGSLLGTGGGLKELYPFTPAQIRQDLTQVFELADGNGNSDSRPIPIRDVYGMAEGNWAAMQCQQGNYHVPPWVYARTLDEDDSFQAGPITTGLLAFYDPYGGGRLFPAFFKAADQVTLVNALWSDAPADAPIPCPCGETGAFITQDSIQRVDLLDEAGCAAQL